MSDAVLTHTRSVEPPGLQYAVPDCCVYCTSGRLRTTHAWNSLGKTAGTDALSPKGSANLGVVDYILPGLAHGHQLSRNVL